MDEKREKTIFQELQELLKSNRHLSKTLKYLVPISIILGIIGLFTNGILFGVWALLFSIIAKTGKQKYATLGFILAIIDILGVAIINVLSNPDLAPTIIISGIMYTIFGILYNFYRDSQSKKR